MSLFQGSIQDLHQKLVNKELTVVELIEATFDRIEATDEVLNAFLTLDKEGALEQANALDEKGIAEGNILASIPIGIKDNIVTKDVETTAKQVKC